MRKKPPVAANTLIVVIRKGYARYFICVSLVMMTSRLG